MEGKDIVEIYENADKRESKKFKDNIDSTLRVQTDFQKIIKDTEWIQKMEETIPYIDNIFRAPNRFIINEEEIVKIERARKITVESIKHLTKNTNFIQEIEKKTGDVKPSKILNINKEESYDTYENKLIYTLVQNMKFFLTRKKKTIEQFSANNNGNNGNKDTKRIDYTGRTKVNNQNVNINLSLDTSLDTDGDGKKQSDDDTQVLLDRIAVVERKITDLTSTEVYKIIQKKHITLITGPIKKTNVILKNVNFQYAMKLWSYLQENIDDKTQNINQKQDYEDKGELKGLIDDSAYLQYLIVNTLDKEKEEELPSPEKEQEVQEVVISNMLEKIMNMNTQLTEDQLKTLIAKKFAIIKYRNMVNSQEIQKVFKKHFDSYLRKIKVKY